MPVQSVLFDRNTWGVLEAMIWLADNGYKSKKIDITKNYMRFRQLKPKRGNKYYTIDLKNGIKLINVL